MLCAVQDPKRNMVRRDCGILIAGQAGSPFPIVIGLRTRIVLFGGADPAEGKRYSNKCCHNNADNRCSDNKPMPVTQIPYTGFTLFAGGGTWHYRSSWFLVIPIIITAKHRCAGRDVGELRGTGSVCISLPGMVIVCYGVPADISARASAANSSIVSVSPRREASIPACL